MATYKSHRNTLYVYCAECGRDITTETTYYEKQVPYCEECNYELGGEEEEEE